MSLHLGLIAFQILKTQSGFHVTLNQTKSIFLILHSLEY